MPPVLEKTAMVTAKGQITVPKPMRSALGVEDGGLVTFRMDEHGITLHRAEASLDDPVIDRFLAFLAKDMERRPEAMGELAPELRARIIELVGDLDVDFDAPIEGDVDL